MAKKIGKAYGFFYCNASKEKIEAELPVVRKYTKTPSELELSLIKGVENLKGDPDLMSIAKTAEESSMNYVIEAIYPNATNRKTADELAAILINTSNLLFCMTDEHIRGEIVYKEKGEYIFREEKK